MGKKDSVTKEFMRDNAIFADAFNTALFDGEQVLGPVLNFIKDSRNQKKLLTLVQEDTRFRTGRRSRSSAGSWSAAGVMVPGSMAERDGARSLRNTGMSGSEADVMVRTLTDWENHGRFF